MSKNGYFSSKMDFMSKNKGKIDKNSRNYELQNNSTQIPNENYNLPINIINS